MEIDVSEIVTAFLYGQFRPLDAHESSIFAGAPDDAKITEMNDSTVIVFHDPETRIFCAEVHPFDSDTWYFVNLAEGVIEERS